MLALKDLMWKRVGFIQPPLVPPRTSLGNSRSKESKILDQSPVFCQAPRGWVCYFFFWLGGVGGKRCFLLGVLEVRTYSVFVVGSGGIWKLDPLKSDGSKVQNSNCIRWWMLKRPILVRTRMQAEHDTKTNLELGTCRYFPGNPYILPWGKEKHLQKWIGNGYLSSLECI